jgi:putative oxidoreductase
MNRLTPYAAVFLRVAVGGVFLNHGWSKLHNFDGVTMMLRGLHIPFAVVFAGILVTVETLGAVCVLAGIMTRIWALAMAIEMTVAILAVVLPHGGTPELEGLLLAGALSLVALGDGPLSVGIRLKRPAM